MLVNNPNINPYQQHYQQQQQQYGSHHQVHMMQQQQQPQHSQPIQIINNQSHFQPSAPLHAAINHIPQQQPTTKATRLSIENTVTDTSQNEENDDEDDEYDEYENNADDQHLYVSVDLSTTAVQKLKSLNLEQCTYLKQLGILSIQFENEKYNLSLMSPPVKRRRRSSSVKQPQIGNNAGVSKKDDQTGASFAYIPTSGLTLDEPSQYVNLAYLGGQPGKQQFAMPCPMLKNLLKTDNGNQNVEVAQSDELLRIIRIRQTLATQTQQQEAQQAAAANSSSAATTTATTAKKPRSRAQSDKPKQKRTKTNKSGDQQPADSGKSGPSGETSTPKKDHHTQEKIRNILNDAQNYQQMTMMNQLGHQQQMIQQQQQPVHQMSQMSGDMNKPQLQGSNSFFGTDQQHQQQQQQITFISQQSQNMSNMSNQNQHISNSNIQISNGI